MQPLHASAPLSHGVLVLRAPAALPTVTWKSRPRAFLPRYCAGLLANGSGMLIITTIVLTYEDGLRAASRERYPT